MKQESFRIINPETNQVKYVGKALFNDIDSLKQMGYIQQDLGQSEDEEQEVKIPVDPTETKIEVSAHTQDVFDPLQIGDPMPDPLADPGEPVVKRKPGRQTKQA